MAVVSDARLSDFVYIFHPVNHTANINQATMYFNLYILPRILMILVKNVKISITYGSVITYTNSNEFQN